MSDNNVIICPQCDEGSMEVEATMCSLVAPISGEVGVIFLVDLDDIYDGYWSFEVRCDVCDWTDIDVKVKVA